jgi:hypothetical protein
MRGIALTLAVVVLSAAPAGAAGADVTPAAPAVTHSAEAAAAAVTEPAVAVVPAEEVVDAVAPLRLDGDRLSVHLDGMPIADVLDALADETGADILGDVAEPREVTKHFDAVPLPQAMRWLLGGQNFTLSYAGNRLVRVTLLDVPQPRVVRGRRRPAARRAAAAAAKPTPISPAARLSQAVRQHPPVPVGDALAHALDVSEARLPLVLRAAARQQDARARRQAMEAFLHAVEDDEALRTAFTEVSDPVLARLVRLWTGTRGTRLLDYLASNTRHPEVRAKAASALDQIHRASAVDAPPAAPRG